MRWKTRVAHLWALPALAMLLCACQSQSVEQTQPNEPQPVAQQQETPTQQQSQETPMTPNEPQQNTQVAYVRMTIEGKGDLVIELDLKEAPKTSENFLNLVKEGFYNGVRFHRVVPRFVIQAGDPKSKTLPMGHPELGTGGSGKNIKFEPNNLKHKRGALGMARAQNPDSASSQFYICLEDLPQLDGDYVIFGRVVEGIEIIDKVRVGDRIQKAVVLENWTPKQEDAPKPEDKK